MSEQRAIIAGKTVRWWEHEMQVMTQVAAPGMEFRGIQARRTDAGEWEVRGGYVHVRTVWQVDDPTST